MRHCAACGEPITAHTYKPVSPTLAKMIHAAAPNAAIARSRVKGAGRVCPIEDTYDDDGRQVARPVRLAEAAAAPEMRLDGTVHALSKRLAAPSRLYRSAA